MYPAQIPHSLFSAGINGSRLNQNYSIAEGKCQSCQAIKKQADRKNGTDQPALVISVHHRSSSVPVRKDAIRQSGAASGIAFLFAAWYNVCITNDTVKAYR